jgi:multidrug efflux pump subunit AcrA (membrane-fusion protein)
VESLRRLAIGSFFITSLLTACSSKPAPQAGAGAPGMQAMPVQTVTVAPQPVPRSDEYVSTIKSRRSATISPQVPGNLVRIDVHSGDHVKAGQMLMEIDPLKQQATVDTQKATEQQKLASIRRKRRSSRSLPCTSTTR